MSDIVHSDMQLIFEHFSSNNDNSNERKNSTQTKIPIKKQIFGNESNDKGFWQPMPSQQLSYVRVKWHMVDHEQTYMPQQKSNKFQVNSHTRSIH